MIVYSVPRPGVLTSVKHRVYKCQAGLGYAGCRAACECCAGGDDFDDVIVEWLAATHLPGVDWRQPAVLTNLKALAEGCQGVKRNIVHNEVHVSTCQDCFRVLHQRLPACHRGGAMLHPLVLPAWHEPQNKKKKQKPSAKTPLRPTAGEAVERAAGGAAAARLGGPDGRGAEAVLTRQLLEELAAPLFRRLRMPIDVACWQVPALPPALSPLQCVYRALACRLSVSWVLNVNCCYIECWRRA